MSIRSGGWTASVWFSAAFPDAIYIAQQPTSEMCETAYQLVRLLGGVHLLKKPVTAMSQGQLRLMLVARSLGPQAGSAAVG